MTSELFGKIKEIVGEDNVSVSEFEKFFYSRDVSPIPQELQQKLGTFPDIIVRPKAVKEVSEIVKIAAKYKSSIVPRGGASWWLGGAVPYKGGIVLDLTSMNDILQINEDNLTVTASCGVTWKELSDYVERKSYFIGTRPGSEISATVGGWISTGGVGIGSYKYGSVGDLVRSLEVVLPNGEIIETGNRELAGNGSGYDMNGLFIGGEGTLGIIVKATLKITPKPDQGPYHFSYSFSSLKDCAKALRQIVQSRVLPYHIAFGDRKHFEFLDSLGKDVPNDDFVLCVILEGEKGIIDYGIEKLKEILSSCHGSLACEDRTIGKCEDCSIEFKGRQANIYPVPGEIFIGLKQFENAVTAISNLRDEMKLKVAIIGSMVDRRTVMFMPYYIHEKEEQENFMDFHRRLGGLAFKLGGRGIGLGLYLTSNLNQIHDKGSVSLMKMIKESIDPDNIMNPGKIFGDEDLIISLHEGK
jgi:glycolate oxidase